MTRYYQIISVCLLLFVAAQFVSAQTSLSGKVTDGTTGEPLIGANITIVGTMEGTDTDFDGEFDFETDQKLPLQLEVTYTGYEDQIVEVATEAALKIKLSSGAVNIGVVEVKGQRVSEKQKAAPLTVESLDLTAIKQTTSDNFYDGLGNLKGVDLVAASLGFKVINTRGFNSTSPVRSLQIIDGVDNQAPGLNFSLGNFLGAPELDVRRVDIIQGASSSFYGPNAFNGVISMETKNPFYTEGLSVQVKGGERSLFNTQLRWADSFKNKDGLKNVAYKFTAEYLRADDWVADNFNAVDGTDTPTGNPGGWDAVNRYGDEYDQSGDFSTNTSSRFNDEAGLVTLHRQGYNEEDLVDYGTRNFKAIGSVYIRTKPEQKEESPEIVMALNYGQGTTVYQGDNRFSLRDITFIQPKIEYRKRDNFFIRAYMSQTDAGNSYDPYFTALRIQERSQNNASYFQRVKKWWGDNNIADSMVMMGYPELDIQIDPNTGQVTTEFDNEAAEQWLEDNSDFLTRVHQQAREFASSNDPDNGRIGRLDPGTPEFQAVFDSITTAFNNEAGGTRFFDRSALYHIHGEKKFDLDFAEITAGANYRLYRPNSRGTIFSDTAGIRINNSEFGFYGGINKKLDDGRWMLSATMRADKNQNFNMLFTPSASAVFSPSPNHYLRISFSSGVRNPTLSDQYLSLDVGPATLAGNLDGRDSLVTLESFERYLSSFLQRSELDYYSIDPIMPEQVRTGEVGYRATLFNNLFLDANYYYSLYTNFIGFNIGLDVEFDNPSSPIPENVDVFRFASNAEDVVTTQGFSIGLNYYFANYFSVNGNYSFNSLVSDVNDPIVPAFNTPEHKYNVGISGRDIEWGRLKNFGFNVNYKWVEGFIFEGSPQFTGFVPSYGMLNGQINYFIPKANLTIKLGATNILDDRNFQTYGGPEIGRLAYISATYEWRNVK